MTEQEQDKLVEDLATFFYYLRKKIIPDPANADKKDLNKFDKCEQILIAFGATIKQPETTQDMGSLSDAINALQPPIIIYKDKPIGKNPVF